MQVIRDYWWLFILPIALVLWVWSTVGLAKGLTKRQWIWILRGVGVVSLMGPAVCLITGNVESELVSIKNDLGWQGVLYPMGIGILALVGAHRLATRKGPPA